MIDFHPHPSPCYRCSAATWECIGTFMTHKGRVQDVIKCAFCGARLRVEAAAAAAAVPVAAKRPTDTATEFRFQFGRFAGKTLDEAAAEPNGRRYLEVLRDTNEKLRFRIEEYLARTA